MAKLDNGRVRSRHENNTQARADYESAPGEALNAVEGIVPRRGRLGQRPITLRPYIERLAHGGR